MKKNAKQIVPTNKGGLLSGYEAILSDIVDLLESAHRASASTVNAIMTASYWEIGRRIVEFEQSGKQRAEYGKALLKRLSADLQTRFGRGVSERNLEQMRLFYSEWPISQTVSAKSQTTAIAQLASDRPRILFDESYQSILSKQFPLSWSHYVVLLSVKNPHARVFYETEAWSSLI